jgi:hypothetical protein
MTTFDIVKFLFKKNQKLCLDCLANSLNYKKDAIRKTIKRHNEYFKEEKLCDLCKRNVKSFNISNKAFLELILLDEQLLKLKSYIEKRKKNIKLNKVKCLCGKDLPNEILGVDFGDGIIISNNLEIFLNGVGFCTECIRKSILAVILNKIKDIL